jgi:dTDP-4-dehydrorhamnose reductase
VKQSHEAKDAELSIYVNSLFPHQLKQVCRWVGARMIHISTDCVFSGNKGNYVESDLADATDLYGKTKSLGEVTDYNCITIRTSFIGSEIKKPKLGLFEWFMSQRGDIDGYTNAWFSGMTTDELSDVIDKYILPNPDMSGLWHVSGTKISKYDLLVMLKSMLGRNNVFIKPNELPVCDRSLNSTKFQKVTGYVPKSWDEMLSEMK